LLLRSSIFSLEFTDQQTSIRGSGIALAADALRRRI
jgi:hypothetical protein